MSSYLSPSHYILLAGLILLASSAATYYNQYLTNRHTAVPEVTPAPVMMADTLPADETENTVDVSDDTADITDETDTIDEASENTIEIEENTADVAENITEDVTGNTEETIETAESIADDKAIEDDTDIENSVSENAEAKETDVLNNISENVSDDDITTENEVAETADETADTEDTAETANEVVEIDTVTEITDNATDTVEIANDVIETEKAEEIIETVEEVSTIEPVEENKTDVLAIPSPDIIAEITAKDNMDDLLDFAYEQNLAENHDTALYAYKEAINRYSEDSYAPFIAIEMINICKSIGAYAEAIDGYNKALLIPSAKDNPQMQKEFKNGIVYIECIIEILNDKNMQNTPLGDIPPQVMKEIELIFAIRKTK